jgi:hypothetical protein
VQEVKNHTALDQHIIRTLIYYDIFSYPLKAKEIYRFLGTSCRSEQEVATALNGLVEQGYLFRFGEFYSLYAQEANIAKRINGNKEAERFKPIAQQRAFFVSKFPFIRSVLGSGSFSKDYMDEGSDLDFFIITAPNRLWIARGLLALYKRIFLQNSHKFFCANYFVDTDHLEIEEKNLFTATELATVVPLYGVDDYHALQQKNVTWLTSYFPNFRPRHTEGVPQFRLSFGKMLMEKLIDLFFGNVVERLIMQMALRRWGRLYRKKYEPHDFKIAFKTKKYVSKNHPRNFQKKVMELYLQKIEMFREKFDLE